MDDKNINNEELNKENNETNKRVKKKKEKATKELKLRFFKRFKLSIFNLEQYHVIAQESIGRSVLYLLKLFLLFSLILSLGCVAKSKKVANEISDFVLKMPNFVITDGEFEMDSGTQVTMKSNEIQDLKIVFNNNEASDEILTEASKNKEGILIELTKNRIIVKYKTMQPQEFSYDILRLDTFEDVANYTTTDDMNNETYGYVVNNKIISDYLKSNTTFLIIGTYIFIYSFILEFFEGLIDAICLAILGYIISRTAGIPLRRFAVYSIGVSSMTFPIVLKLIYLLVHINTGFTMDTFQIMYTIIAYVYLFFAIFILRSNLLTTDPKKAKEDKKDKDKQKKEGLGEEGQ